MHGRIIKEAIPWLCPQRKPFQMRQVAQAVPHQPCHCVGNGGNGHRIFCYRHPHPRGFGGIANYQAGRVVGKGDWKVAEDARGIKRSCQRLAPRLALT